MKTGMNSMDSLLLCIPRVAAPIFPGSEIPPEFRPKSQLLQNPAGFSLDPPCGNGGGAGIWNLFPVGISDTCAFGQRVFHDFSWKKTSFGMCWMGGKGSGTLGIPWGWNMGWKTGMEPLTGSINSLPVPEFHPEIPKKPLAENEFPPLSQHFISGVFFPFGMVAPWGVQEIQRYPLPLGVAQISQSNWGKSQWFGDPLDKRDGFSKGIRMENPLFHL